MKTRYSYCKFCKELVESDHLWKNHYEEKRELEEVFKELTKKKPKKLRKIKIVRLATRIDRNEVRLANFLSKIQRLDNGCWEWIGSRFRSSYGLFSIAGKPLLAHRVSYILFGDKELLRDRIVHHECHRRSCVNPSHLRQMTRRDHWNLHRKERQKRGRNKR